MSVGWAALVVRTATVVVLGVAVVCQLIQHTDPTFALAYFTVLSALLLAVVLVACQVRPGIALVERARGAASVGVLASALVYVTVIVPASAAGTWFAPGDDVPVRIATVLMHGVGPFLAIGDFVLHPVGAAAVRSSSDGTVQRLRTALVWLAWPLAYLLVMVVLQVARVGQVPYTFLQVHSAGDLPAMLGATVVLIVAMTGLGLLLLALRARVGVSAAPAGSRRRAPVTRRG